MNVLIPCEFQFNTSWYDSNQVHSSGTINSKQNFTYSVGFLLMNTYIFGVRTSDKFDLGHSTGSPKMKLHIVHVANNWYWILIYL